MHAIKEKPVVVNGQIVIRPIMVVALTYDHRLLDGREAVTFLGQSAYRGAPYPTLTLFLSLCSQGPRLHRRPQENASRPVLTHIRTLRVIEH